MPYYGTRLTIASLQKNNSKTPVLIRNIICKHSQTRTIYPTKKAHHKDEL